MKQWQEAVDMFESAARTNPTDGQALFYLGLANVYLGNEDEAREAIERAYALKTSYDGSRMQLAMVARLQGDLEREIVLLTDAISNNDPHPYLLRYRLGKAYLSMEQIETARAIFEHTIGLTPSVSATYGIYHMMGAICLSTGELELAISYFEEQILRNPEYSGIANTHYNLGLVYHYKKAYRQAIAQFQQAIKRNPENSDAFFYLAISHWYAGQHENVAPLIEKLSQLDPQRAIQLNDMLQER